MLYLHLYLYFYLYLYLYLYLFMDRPPDSPHPAHLPSCLPLRQPLTCLLLEHKVGKVNLSSMLTEFCNNNIYIWRRKLMNILLWCHQMFYKKLLFSCGFLVKAKHGWPFDLQWCPVNSNVHLMSNTRLVINNRQQGDYWVMLMTFADYVTIHTHKKL